MKQVNRLKKKNHRTLERFCVENYFSNVLKFWLYLIATETGSCRHCSVVWLVQKDNIGFQGNDPCAIAECGSAVKVWSVYVGLYVLRENIFNYYGSFLILNK